MELPQLPSFQKLLDHRGCVLNFVTGALVHLQIGRAYAMAGESAKAKSAYNDFLTLQKDADPDIPILKQAKVDYAKLQWLLSGFRQGIVSVPDLSGYRKGCV